MAPLDPDPYRMLVGLLTERFDVPAEEMRPETTFADLDLDSLDLTELATLVQKRHGILIGDARRTSSLRQAAAMMGAGQGSPETAR